MKTIRLLILLGFVVLISCNNSKDITEVNDKQPSEFAFDSVLAAKYGADDYGMKKYVMAFLKRGPNQELDAQQRAEIQAAHMENIGRMADEGKLVLAGPFFGDGDLRGIYVFNVQSIEEAEALTNTDPAIKAGTLEMELIEWYGSAALMAIYDISKKISKTEI